MKQRIAPTFGNQDDVFKRIVAETEDREIRTGDIVDCRQEPCGGQHISEDPNYVPSLPA